MLKQGSSLTKFFVFLIRNTDPAITAVYGIGKPILKVVISFMKN
jgi:hypothetical protein